MSRKLLFLGLMMISLMGFSQQEIQYTNFMFSNMAFNPGYAGINRAICATALYRQQWMGFSSSYGGDKGAPEDFYLTVESNIDLIHGGVGLTILKDKIGFEDNIAVRLAYSFHLNVGPGKLGIGLQAGMINKKIDFSKFKPVDPGDPLLSSKNIETAMSFDMAFGAYYKIDQVMYAGLSSTQLTQSVAEFASNIGSPEYKRHYFLYGGYYWQLPMAPNIVINPNVMVKTDFVSAQYDINVLGWYNNAIYAGVTYRAIDAIAILAGANIPQVPGLKGGVSYDITTSSLGGKGSDGNGSSKRRSFGSAEIYINYCFEIVIKVKPERHKTVLFL
jgi:type IX secretion system PorP/SprF family membrane protein